MQLITRRCARIAVAAALLLVCSADSDAGDLENAQQIAENLRNGGMKHYSVGVGVKTGVVTLRGTVANDEQRRLALSIARRADGVEQVLDQLQLSPYVPKLRTTGPRGWLPLSPSVEPAAFKVIQPRNAMPSRLGFVDLTAYIAISAARNYLIPDTGRFDVELDDGSRIVAQSVRPPQFHLETKLGTMTVPVKLVESIERSDGENAFRVRLSNGDRITGRIEFPNNAEVQLIAAHGEMRVSPNAILNMMRRGSGMPLRN